jgi:deazaflavin-dependent oxidoreductase (nitroreductase family)
MAFSPPFKLISAVHVWLFRSSGGKRGSSLNGQDVVLLTTRGRKTGKQRSVPLMGFADGADRIVIGSKGGTPEHPAWFLNLEADPDVSVEVGGERWRAKAVITADDERERLWNTIVAKAPQFSGYAKKTTRKIPVIRLVRAD